MGAIKKPIITQSFFVLGFLLILLSSIVFAPIGSAQTLSGFFSSEKDKEILLNLKQEFDENFENLSLSLSLLSFEATLRFGTGGEFLRKFIIYTSSAFLLSINPPETLNAQIRNFEILRCCRNCPSSTERERE